MNEFNAGSQIHDDIHVQLTKTDREILASYQAMLDGLADYLGDAYEFVLHSLEDLDSSVIKIINGFHTGRSEGAPITNLALDVMKQIKDEKLPGFISYFAKNKFGEPLKSTTIIIYGEKQRIIGLLCINFYLNTPMFSVIKNIMDQADLIQVNNEEHFADCSADMISKAVEKARNDVEADASIPVTLKNKQIITQLESQGIFNMKNAVTTAAKILRISKNTVYLHLRNNKAGL